MDRHQTSLNKERLLEKHYLIIVFIGLIGFVEQDGAFIALLINDPTMHTPSLTTFGESWEPESYPICFQELTLHDERDPLRIDENMAAVPKLEDLTRGAGELDSSLLGWTFTDPPAVIGRVRLSNGYVQVLNQQKECGDPDEPRHYFYVKQGSTMLGKYPGPVPNVVSVAIELKSSTATLHMKKYFDGNSLVPLEIETQKHPASDNTRVAIVFVTNNSHEIDCKINVRDEGPHFRSFYDLSEVEPPMSDQRYLLELPDEVGFPPLNWNRPNSPDLPNWLELSLPWVSNGQLIDFLTPINRPVCGMAQYDEIGANQ